jgi:predicted O-methyltransferase YrrM
MVIAPMNRALEFTTDWFGDPTRWLQLLEPLIGRPNTRYLEVGSFEGRSLLWMMENIFSHASARGVAIDPCITPFQERLRRNIAASGHGARIQVIQGTSRQEMWRLPRESFDVILVDGSHLASDVLHDAVVAWELLKINGVLILDDYQLGTPVDPAFNRHLASDLRPREAIDAFVLSHRRELEVVYSDYQMVLRKKPTFSTRYDVANYGNAQFCSALGPHLYYWDQRKLVTLPEVLTRELDDGDARLVEEYLLTAVPGADLDSRVQALLARLRPRAGDEPAGSSGEITSRNAYRAVNGKARPCIVQNRAWAGTQSIAFESSDFRVTRQATSSPTPISFPSVFIGVNHGRSTAGSNLPKRARDLRHIRMSWKNNVGAVPADCAAACGVSFSTRADGDAGAPTGGNLRLWHSDSGRTPPGTCVERDIAIAGVEGTWELWCGRDGEGVAVSYVGGQGLSSVALDLNGFILDAMARGRVPGSVFVSSVFAGFLIWSGGVGLESTGFEAEVE